MRAPGVFFLIAGACCAQVQNGADAGAGVNTAVLAPGSRAVVHYFQNAGASPASATVSFLPVNTTTPFPAPIVSVSPTAIDFIVPPDVPAGPAQLIYKPGNQVTQWTTVTIVPASFSLYRTGPVGPLIAQNVPPTGPAYPNGLATPAQPGQGVQVYASGAGVTPVSRVQVTLGGVPQQVTYAGTPPYLAGLTQIDFLIAPGTPDGCYVPLLVTSGTQTVSSFLSKTSDGMPCHHPWGLSAQALTILDNGGAIQTVNIDLTTGIDAATANLASRQESGQIITTSMTAGQIASSFVPLAANPATPCGFFSEVGNVFAVLAGAGGASATLTNSAGTITLPYTGAAAGDSPLSGLPPPVIAPGPWKFTALDSSEVPSGSSFTFALPQPVLIAGGAPIVIDHTASPTITWNGADYDSSATLQLNLTAPYSPVVACTAPAQSGSVTIPANLLASYRAGSTGVLSVTVRENGSGIPAADFAVRSAPVLALVLWTSSDARPVDFR